MRELPTNFLSIAVSHEKPKCSRRVGTITILSVHFKCSWNVHISKESPLEIKKKNLSPKRRYLDFVCSITDSYGWDVLIEIHLHHSIFDRKLQNSLSSGDRINQKTHKSYNFHFDRMINIIIRTNVSVFVKDRNNRWRTLKTLNCTRSLFTIQYSIFSLLTRVTITILQLHWRFRCIHNFSISVVDWLDAAVAEGFSVCPASAWQKKRENHRFH